MAAKPPSLTSEPQSAPKVAPKPTISAIRAFIAANSPAMVLISAAHAHHFRAPPRDGNTYVVEDPVRRGDAHWTAPDGSYTHISDAMRIHVEPKKVRGASRKQRKARHVDQLPAHANLIPVSASEPVPMRLIKLDRVMQITGFRKSFLYEQPDFPKPVKLGTAQRAPARWLESEVTAWVEQLLARRDTKANKA